MIKTSYIESMFLESSTFNLDSVMLEIYQEPQILVPLEGFQLGMFSMCCSFPTHWDIKLYRLHCVKIIRIRSCSGPHFPAFGLNTDQNNSEYGHFLRSVRRIQSTQIFYISR